MFVKICGITRVEDALAAAARGASAVGFVFWPSSPRVVDPATARAIGERLPPGVERVGVFVNQALDEVNGIARQAGLTMVQLHGEEDAGYAARIERPVIKAATLENGVPPLAGWRTDMIWLIDAHDRRRRGGTGLRVDWSAAAVVAAERQMLLAGGITPENVAEALEVVRPFGIDVSSGVEVAPGIKDPARIDALFEAVHAFNAR